MQGINFLLCYSFNILGILPRTWAGIPGIILAPLLHGSFSHLFFNSLPLFLLINLVLFEGMPTFLVITGLITFLSGAGTWCFGRRAYHIGASGLILGYAGYLMLNAILKPSVVSLLLIIFYFYYLGALLSSLIPKEDCASWEGHIFGLLAGLSVRYFNLADDLLSWLT